MYHKKADYTSILRVSFLSICRMIKKNFWITLILELYVSGSETSRFHLKCIQKCREKGCNRLACVCMCQWKCDRLSEQRKYEVSSVHEKNYRCLMTSCLSVDIEKNWRKKTRKVYALYFHLKIACLSLFSYCLLSNAYIFIYIEKECVCVWMKPTRMLNKHTRAGWISA